MISSTSKITTAKANNYLQQMCKYFGNEREIVKSENFYTINFEFGSGELSAEENLLALIARANDAEQLKRAETVLGSHLERFAFRENVSVIWSRPSSNHQPKGNIK